MKGQKPNKEMQRESEKYLSVAVTDIYRKIMSKPKKYAA